ncbi:amino acid adenylation domain-containing protein [Rhodococcus artemisiae]|uniref:Amino acid adenylation domain-containing protein n=1 Tax=Rhodococcus artemisiae TaxID=714159 RepID=A0ABU7LBY4_9NOCA|nr:amino acid adenylation domain-containing protein [Rhodococcus artemisiae]MEE2059058.1 amino acid adenylation domain-containing protein [Rhodococcus artemisiae]
MTQQLGIEAEQADIVTLQEQWNDRSTPATTTTVPELFAEAVRSHADAPALVDGQRRLTYAELSAKVQQLAHRLRQSGLAAEEVVAICMPRSAEMVIGVLASMVAGGAFVPVDPQWPATRRAQVIADSSARIALVAPDHQASLPTEELVVSLDDWRFEEPDPLPSPPAIVGNQLAYVIFTSGSTGTPKGAMIRHEAIAERLTWQRDHVILFGPGDASLFKAPLAFDISVNEILLPLISGGYVVVAASGSEQDPDYLLDLITAERVTYLYLVSSMLDAMLALDLERAACEGSALTSVQHVWCGGEVLTPDLFDRFRQQLSTTLYHGYGPAEATIGVSHVIYRDRAERISTSIGRPNPHTQLYVLDDNLSPTPVGDGGELYVAGFLLGRGYVGNAALTAGRFVANPFDPDGARMYRTGDLARWTTEGSLEFLGRADNQVKIGGRRVELEEIEVAIARHPSVRHAVVTMHRNDSGVQSLVGYATEMPGSTLDVDVLRQWCREWLPDYMVPTQLMVLDSFPVNTNGKVDRRALPAPTEVQREGLTAPTTAHEALLCDIFAKALGLDEVGVDDDFYALGGDSIMAVTVVRALRSQRIKVRTKDVTAHRTARRLAATITDSDATTDKNQSISDRPLVVLDDEDAADLAATVADLRAVLPLTSVQSGIYFHSLAAPDDDPYIVQQVVDLIGPLEPARLQQATRAAIDRHEALGAGFHTTASGRLISTIGATVAPEFRTLDFIGRSESETEEFVAKVAHQERARGFDLTQPPLLRYALITIAEDHHRLVQTAHHLIADGWSVALIWDDIMAAYRGQVFESPAPQFTDFLRWWVHHRDPEREVAAWSRYLTGVDTPTLVSDLLPRPEGGTGFGRRRRSLDSDQRRALRTYARSQAVTEAAVLTVAWGITVGCIMSSTDVVFGSTTAGRGEDVGGLDRIVGMLVNTVPTRVRWSLHDTVDEIVQRFVAAETTVLDHQHVPLLDVHASLGVNELFDTLFAIQNLQPPETGDRLQLGPIHYIENPHYRLSALVNLHESVAVELTNDRAAIDDMVADQIVDLYLRAVELIVGSASGTQMVDENYLTGNDPLDGSNLTALQSDPPMRLTATRASGLWPIAAAHASLPGFEQFTQSSTFVTPAGLDKQSLKRVLHQVVDHHPALHGRVVRGTTLDQWRFETPNPIAAADQRITVESLSVSWASDSWRDRVSAVKTELSEALDPENGVMWRAMWFTNDQEEHGRLLLVIHHLVVDGVSWRILGDDLAQAWQLETGASTKPLLPVGTSFPTWSAALTSRAGDDDVVAQVDYWTDVLAGEDPLLGSRPLDPKLDTYAASGEVQIAVPEDVTRSVLSDLPRALASEVNDVLLGALAVAVGAWRARRGVNHRRVVIGLEGHGREESLIAGADLSSTVGWFTSWSPVALDTCDIDPTAALTDPAAAANAVLRVKDALRHVPDRGMGYGLLRYLNPTTSGALAAENAPQIGFNYLGQFGNAGAKSAAIWHPAPEKPGIEWHAPDTLRSPAVVDINIAAVPGPDGLVLQGSFRFATGIIDEADVDDLAALWGAALATLSTHAQTRSVGRRFADLTLVRERDRHQIAAWSSGEDRDTAAVTVDALLQNQAAAGTGVALADDTDAVELSFSALDSRVNALAALLVEYGIEVGDRVAVLLPRSVDLVVALAGVMRAGAACVPLAEYPAERIGQIVADSGAAVVITDGHTSEAYTRVLAASGVRLLKTDDRGVVGALDRGREAPPVLVRALTAHDAAYVIFTSGTTGRPKGVTMSHRALVNRLTWGREVLGFGPDCVALWKSGLGFVDAATELFGPLTAGATVVVSTEESASDPAALADAIHRYGVTHLLTVPSLADALIRVPDAATALASVRQWVSSGESLTSSTAEAMRQIASGAVIHNFYGSTEVAGDATTAAVANDDVTIGSPVTNTLVRVLDSWLRPVAPGVVGELYIGGAQLADAYVGQPSLTAARFIADPHSKTGERLYRTGDLVRWSTQGALEYQGRSDDQVKLHGVRIELDEVRNALEQLDAVSGAAVVALDHPTGGKFLAAYVTVADHGTDEDAALADLLRGQLAARLPNYMVPTTFSRLAEFPVTVNGKLDKTALPVPDTRPGATGGRAPETDTEIALAAIFSEVLKLGRTTVLSADDDFFRLGGDSISSISVVRQANKRGLTFTIRDVFALRSPARLASACVTTSPGVTPQHDGPPSATAGDPIPIAPTVNQHRLRLSGSPIDDHLITEVIDLPQAVDSAQVKSAIASVLHDIDTLRQRVTPHHRLLWTAEVMPYTEQSVAESISLHERPDSTSDRAVKEVRAQLVEHIDITAGRALHAGIVGSAKGVHLVLAVHGLAADRRTVHQLAARVQAQVNGVTTAAAATVRSIADTSEVLDNIAASAESDAAMVEWADYLNTLPVAAHPAGELTLYTTRVSWPIESPAPPEVIETAFLAAVVGWSDGEGAVDLEWDLRTHLRAARTDADDLPGALTVVYPRLGHDQAGSWAGYAPWHDLLRYQNRRGRKKLRGAPKPGLLLTRLYGRTADPTLLEGFESFYDIVARYRTTTEGIDLQVLGPDQAAMLLDRWVDELDSAAT